MEETMRFVLLTIFALILSITPVLAIATAPDVSQAPSCKQCGMDRGKFSHSRMFITYEDGSAVGTCSLHCAAVELAAVIDKGPAMLRVADYDTRERIDAENAVWVMGGNKKGVMTGVAKWAFASRES